MFRSNKKARHSRFKNAQKGSHKVFSYHSQRQQSDNNAGRQPAYSPTVKSKGKRTIRLLIFLVILAAFLYVISLDPAPKVVLLQKDGTAFRETSDYSTGVVEIWGKSLNSRTKLTLNSAQIRSQILSKYPELALVKIEIPLFGRSSTVFLEPTKPAIELVNQEGSFWVRSDGVALGKTSEFSASNVNNLPKVEDNYGLEVEPGKHILTEGQTGFIAFVFEGLSLNNLQVESMSMPPIPLELDVRLKGFDYYLKFNLNGDAALAVGQYLAAKTKFDESKEAPKDYVDLRLSEKVFYK